MPGGGRTAFGNTSFISASFAAINGTAAPLARDVARSHEEPDRAAQADDDLRDHEAEAHAVRGEIRALGDEPIDTVRADRQKHDRVHEIASVPRHDCAVQVPTICTGMPSGSRTKKP